MAAFSLPNQATHAESRSSTPRPAPSIGEAALGFLEFVFMLPFFGLKSIGTAILFLSLPVLLLGLLPLGAILIIILLTSISGPII